jgi:hypothetical protein
MEPARFGVLRGDEFRCRTGAGDRIARQSKDDGRPFLTLGHSSEGTAKTNDRRIDASTPGGLAMGAFPGFGLAIPAAEG